MNQLTKPFKRSQTGRYFVIWDSLIGGIKDDSDGWVRYLDSYNVALAEFYDLYGFEDRRIITEEEFYQIGS